MFAAEYLTQLCFHFCSKVINGKSSYAKHRRMPGGIRPVISIYYVMLGAGGRPPPTPKKKISRTIAEQSIVLKMLFLGTLASSFYSCLSHFFQQNTLLSVILNGPVACEPSKSCSWRTGSTGILGSSIAYIYT
ncbi:hypothetical protein I7I53_11147 [Histoplasma capsulatum var. duboisii H88]|uniref:Uncharacterized protein n=1 Tax=Ajellomyces capsulatus (strain H88) TaxID=544711 RepID=A0A8A1LDD1_AJEC8|nr:hypothetical protein I7I53_11147 [Histoplasma capsulatum var. duboisii H88]